MHWHYQVIQHTNHVELVEALEEYGHTEALLVGDDVDDLLHQLEMMIEDIKHYKVINKADLPERA
jgi:hypothetical protein